MDWNAAVEKNREALKRILAALVAMAGLASAFTFTSPLRGGRPSPDGRVGVLDGSAEQPPPDASRRPPHKGEVEPGPTLPRHLHRAVLRLLRPAESAARRLIIVAARGLVVPAPRPRRPKPSQTTPSIVRNGVGTGIVMPRGFLLQARPRPPAARTPSLPLFDTLPRWNRRRRAASGVPRICFPGLAAPFPVAVRRPPSPDDPLDASRLHFRLQALGRVLDDLPGQAKRFARWRASRDAARAQDRRARGAGRARRVWPLRPGRPPGWRRKRTHEVHEVLDVMQGLAFWALERPDTS